MSKLLKRESVGALASWRAPEMSGSETATATRSDEDAFEVARLEGYRQGLEEARRAAAEQGARFDALLTRLARPFEGYEDALQEEVLALVRALTRQLVRREMRADPAQVIGVIREAVKTLPAAASNLVVRLNPEDAALVSERLATSEGRRPWRLQEDAAMQRGGCVVSADNTRVDGTLEARLGRLIAEMLGSERSDDA